MQHCSPAALWVSTACGGSGTVHLWARAGGRAPCLWPVWARGGSARLGGPTPPALLVPGCPQETRPRARPGPSRGLAAGSTPGEPSRAQAACIAHPGRRRTWLPSRTPAEGPVWAQNRHGLARRAAPLAPALVARPVGSSREPSWAEMKESVFMVVLFWRNGAQSETKRGKAPWRLT